MPFLVVFTLILIRVHLSELTTDSAEVAGRPGDFAGSWSPGLSAGGESWTLVAVMRGYPSGMAALIVWGSLLLQGFGQRAVPESLAQNGLPEPPGFGVLDQNGVFGKNSVVMRRISDRIRKLEADHGFRIYLVVEPVLLSSSAPELAAQLQQAWKPEGDGLVVVFEADNRNIGFGRDIGGKDHASSQFVRVPTHETAAMLRDVVANTDKSLAPEVCVESLIDRLADGFDDYFKRRAAPIPATRSLRMALLTAGALTLLALGAIGVGSLTRLRSVAGTQTYKFPVVDRPERLGAPCGGGNVSTRRFKRMPPT
jgi:hypothetical protein